MAITALALTAASFVAYSAWEELTIETDLLQRQIITLGNELDSLTSSIEANDVKLGVLVSDFESIAEAPDPFPRITEMEQSTATLASSVSDIERDLVLASIETTGIKLCINTYMAAIGDWSRNVSSYYTYYYC